MTLLECISDPCLVSLQLCEAGNFSIHLTLNNLRGDGKKAIACPLTLVYLRDLHDCCAGVGPDVVNKFSTFS